MQVTLQPKQRRGRRSGALFLALGAALAVSLTGAPALADDPWPDIRAAIFDNRDVVEDDTVTLDAPYRAEDAAVVPITMRIPADVAEDVKSLTLVVDKNPMPVAAKFEFGDAAGPGERMISTRVRIDMYSNVRAVIETKDGKLHMATKYVKASGGCSAPAGKDADEALANMGKIKIRTFEPDNANASGTRQAQVMIRHPNFTGMQMDQLPRQYTPARYVDNLEVKRGDDLIFSMQGGISISENPHFRFTFATDGKEPIAVTAKDTEGSVFKANSTDSAS